ncbi:vanadium-dependent haloperoxidase [Flavihumibacter solisilvae]|uniref:Haloperoxidase n=1 Tax=Flavihumibacter solisilvae TaxID=1349421 RepID=A0A0C1IY58_9BACT|nr:vanadium-dependent haloperoxidase [Flavihumibacter solisilvae]KIC95434.1 haloperoxidase [Flavihumibacter solisilvae]
MKKLLILLCCVLPGFFARAAEEPAPSYLELRPVIFSLTMIMMHDVVNPPAASRYYAYCMAGAYEIVAQNDPSVTGLGKFVTSYPAYTIGKQPGTYDFRVAAVYCVLETGKLMIPSGLQLQEEQAKFLKTLRKNGVAQKSIEAAVKVAEGMAAHIVKWSKTDNYFKLSALRRYRPLKGEGNWYPTPPAYMEAVEPNWATVRPMIIDSCSQFKPAPPVNFSKDSTSEFYRLAREVYEVSVKPDQEKLNIAGFWDCNPFAVTTSGHMSIGFKKMSPGGHWMLITGIACKDAKLSVEKSVVAHLMVGLTLMDAFISCWDEKFRSNRIRPETYINRYIDPRWQPLLQTPPFPEYTSGHSVISTASAEVLTYLFGDNFRYTDDAEVMFELAPRTFTSFRAAAAEAAVSRLYGGIHFRDAIENGAATGRELGQFIVEKLRGSGVAGVW